MFRWKVLAKIGSSVGGVVGTSLIELRAYTVVVLIELLVRRNRKEGSVLIEPVLVLVLVLVRPRAENNSQKSAPLGRTRMEARVDASTSSCSGRPFDSKVPSGCREPSAFRSASVIV